MRISRHIINITLTVAALSLSACHLREALMNQDSIVSSGNTTLKTLPYDHQVATATLDNKALQTLGDSYRDNGTGPLDIVVTYDPKSHSNTAMKATQEAQRMATRLKHDGVTDISTDILPVAAPGPSQTLISYKTVTAVPPDCDAIGGLDGRPTDPREYELGCTIDGQIARQIANPQDLQGRAGMDTGSGRRQGNIPEAYQKGTPNPAMQNIQSSTTSSQ